MTRPPHGFLHRSNGQQPPPTAAGVPLIFGIRVLTDNFYTEFRGGVPQQCGGSIAAAAHPITHHRPCGCGSGRQQCRPLLDVVWMRGQPLFCADCRVAWTSCNCRSAVLEMLQASIMFWMYQPLRCRMLSQPVFAQIIPRAFIAAQCCDVF